LKTEEEEEEEEEARDKAGGTILSDAELEI